jgi:hypothetical protein
MKPNLIYTAPLLTLPVVGAMSSTANAQTATDVADLFSSMTESDSDSPTAITSSADVENLINEYGLGDYIPAGLLERHRETIDSALRKYQPSPRMVREALDNIPMELIETMPALINVAFQAADYIIGEQEIDFPEFTHFGLNVHNDLDGVLFSIASRLTPHSDLAVRLGYGQGARGGIDFTHNILGLLGVRLGLDYDGKTFEGLDDTVSFKGGLAIPARPEVFEREYPILPIFFTEWGADFGQDSDMAGTVGLLVSSGRPFDQPFSFDVKTDYRFTGVKNSERYGFNANLSCDFSDAVAMQLHLAAHTHQMQNTTIRAENTIGGAFEFNLGEYILRLGADYDWRNKDLKVFASLDQSSLAGFFRRLLE